MIHIDTNEAVQMISDIVIKIEESHDKMLKEIKTGFKPTLINLEIEDAHIKELNGVKPIAQNLEKKVNDLQNILVTLIFENRDNLNEALEVLQRKEMR